MYEYKIKVNKDLDKTLKAASESLGMTIENFILEILNRYFVPLHTINQDEMAKGYKEMGEINVELSK